LILIKTRAPVINVAGPNKRKAETMMKLEIPGNAESGDAIDRAFSSVPSPTENLILEVDGRPVIGIAAMPQRVWFRGEAQDRGVSDRVKRPSYPGNRNTVGLMLERLHGAADALNRRHFPSC
jgi:hypothetical protein